MYVSALCFPAVSMIAGCSDTQSRDPVSPVLHGLAARKERATVTCGALRSCTSGVAPQGQVGQCETYMMTKGS